VTYSRSIVCNFVTMLVFSTITGIRTAMKVSVKTDKGSELRACVVYAKFYFENS